MLKKIGIFLGVLLLNCLWLNNSKASLAEEYDWLRENLHSYASAKKLPKPNGSLSFEGKGVVYSLPECEGLLESLYERQTAIPQSVRDFLRGAIKDLYGLGIPAHSALIVNSGFVCLLKRLEMCSPEGEDYEKRLVQTSNKTFGFHGALVGKKFGDFVVTREHCAACLGDPEVREAVGFPEIKAEEERRDSY